MSVYFVKWDAHLDLLKEADRLYEAAGAFDNIEKDDLVAIKFHVGELGNPYYIQPFFIHDIAEKIRAKGGKAFITDSNTYYDGNRYNAYDHMVNALMNGFNMAPFIVADGLRSENYRMVKTKGILSEIEVSGVIAEADAMIVVSHCKGHELAGFGGAIKNLGMGCTPQSGKMRQHRTVGLEIDESKCDGCGKCKEACPLNLPEIIGEKAVNLSPKCMRCPICSIECPQGAITLTHKENICRALASAAYGVLSTFKKNKVSYVNFAKDIAQHCDCMPNPGRILMDDIGIFASNSPASIDAAFLRMANYEIFNDVAHLDCMAQVQEAIKLGIEGDTEPKITAIN